MLKLSQKQSQNQALSPQQIQFIQLLRIPTGELEARIKEEMESNPLLEEGADSLDSSIADDDTSLSSESNNDEFSEDEYYHSEEYEGYKMQGDSSQAPKQEIPIIATTNLNEQLLYQLRFLDLDNKSFIIGQQLIGSIDDSGYITRDLLSIVDDLAINQNIETSEGEVEIILKELQTLDPPGIAARNLQECLLIQLYNIQDNNNKTSVEDAIKIVKFHFDTFKMKHFDILSKKANLTEIQVKEAINQITRLNPKPGNRDEGMVKTHYLQPDFILEQRDKQLSIRLDSLNAPSLKVSDTYSNMLTDFKDNKPTKKGVVNSKETFRFLKEKMDNAHWFIHAIKKRQETLLQIMGTIFDYQKEFFKTEDEKLLKPMILQDIADIVNMDISTISRVVNSKSIQTDFGLFPLKYFFSEKITTLNNQEVSNKEVKNILKKIIDDENKKKPLSDEKITLKLQEEGYSIKRRTVSKYREMMSIPVARLRREIIL